MLLVAVLPAALISVVLALYLIMLRFNDADRALEERGAALTRLLMPAAEYGAFSGNVAELRRLAEAVVREPNVTAVSFYDQDGVLLVSVGDVRFTENPTKLDDAWAGASKDQQTLFFHGKIHPALPAFDDPFEAAQPASSQAANSLPPTEATAPPPPLGSLTLEISRSAVTAAKKETLLVTLLLALVTLFGSSLLARRLSRDVTEPILALQQTVAEIQHGNLEARLTPHPAHTLIDLEQGVNAMAASLQAGRDELESRIAEATRELRLKKEEAERMSQAKSRFLAAASHDLRQPLHALSLFTNELEAQASPASQRRMLRRIGNAVDALNEQLNALLDISRLDLADIVPHRESIALEGLIERVIAVHLPTVQAKGLRLRLVPTRAWVRSDPRLLERMIGNLLSNAIRYTDAGGILIGVRHRGNDWRLEICDTGIGINNEQVPLIFEEFYQVANLERDAEKGLGLGLAIVARLAQILEHSVSVRSRPGHGSVFAITMPETAPLGPTEQPGEVIQDLNAGFNIDVLVLSADPEAGSHLAKLLKGWGCRIIHPLEGTQTEYPSAPRPQVVICDEASYAQASNAIRTGPEPEPILILIGEGAPRQDRPAAAAQLVLPLRPARLRALLQHLLQERQPQADAGQQSIEQPLI